MKAETQRKKCFGGFSLKTKTYFFAGQKKIVFKKLNFQFVFLHLFFNVKGSFVLIFTKKYLGPLEFFENENFDGCAMPCALGALKFWIWTSKIIPDLWLPDLFGQIK